MVPRAGKIRAGTRRGRGGTARRRPRPEDDAPDAFRDLLSGAVTPRTASATEENRPLKRRKVVGKGSGTQAAPSSFSQPDNRTDSGPSQAALQTIIDDSEESDSDVEFEDVYLGPSHTNRPDAAPADEQGPLQITIGAATATNRRTNLRKRKPVTAAEKARRLSCHKMHTVFLLYHAFHRNHWCNDAKTQARRPRMFRVITF
jgi:xeroderma pigmentosum group C-complementing protein